MPTYHHNRIHYLPTLVFVVLSVILLLLTVAPYTVRADTIPNPLGVASFAELVANLANAVTKIAIPFVVVFLVYAGFLFVTARGDVKQLETAKKTFYWTIVGAAVVVGAAALANAAVDFVKSIGVP